MEKLPDQVPHGVREESGGGGGCAIVAMLLIVGAAVFFFRDHISAFFDDGEIDLETLLVSLIPVVFIVAFAAIVFMIRRRSRARSGSGVTAMTSSSGRGSTGGPLFFGIFLLIGIASLIPFFYLGWNLYSSMSWAETECTIVSSNVGSHSSSDGTTYSIDIRYSYEWEGQTYTSSDYNLLSGSSSGYSGKEAVVKRYPAGSTATCWVNPADPSEAVLDRSIDWWILFFLLFPIAFIGVGAAGLSGKFSTASRSPRIQTGDDERSAAFQAAASSPRTEQQHEMLEKLQDLMDGGSQSLVLTPSSTPAGKVGGASCIAIFWNGIVGTIAFFVLKDGSVDGCAVAFLSLFGLVGVLLLLSIPYYILAMRNPIPTLRLSDNFAPGRTITINWEFSGDASRIRAFTLKMTGEESATYRRGTNTSTSTETFFEEEIISVSPPATMAHGSVEFQLPENVMHSFVGTNNRIKWSLDLRGDIPRWPDVIESYAVQVKPETLS